MYLKDNKTNNEAPEARRAIQENGKEGNERACVYKSLVFRPPRKREGQGTANKSCQVQASIP